MNIRYTETEHAQLTKLFQQSGHKEISEYVRRITLGKPVNVKYRNQSVDDFLADMVALRRDLNAIGNNFNQSVHRLHTLSRTVDIQRWLIENEENKTTLFRTIETINNRINQLYAQWS